ncbi:unnamed protein product [Urochloa decumbens]|uniref:SCP domain-containing protein n=1 Tax=Urochloa decumbens TaxID=240449 RepID=A0ABC9EZW8_9POAL
MAEKFAWLALAAFAMAAMVTPCAAQNDPQDFLDLHDAARNDVGVGTVSWDDNVAAYAQNYAAGRLRPPALRRALRREPLLGLRRRRLVGGGRRRVVGVGEAVVRPRQQQLLGAAGRYVPPLHAGCVARFHGHWLRPRRLRQQRRCLHHLQLQPAGQRRRTKPLLEAEYYSYD